MDQDRINSYIQQGLFDGTIVLAGSADKDLMVYTQGLADRTNDRPMTPDTVFDISSISKPLGTATGILLLADRALLKLDVPFTEYLPQYRGKLEKKIDLRMLASHFSGIQPDYPRDVPAENMLQRMLASPFPDPQWKSFRYSCVNYNFMGFIIENVSGKSLGDFARENIFEPLQMNDTSWAVPLDHVRDRLVVHSRCVESDRSVVYDLWARKFAPRAMGNAGIFTTAYDMAKYARMILSYGKGLFKSDLVREEMMHNYVPQADRNRSFGWDMTRRMIPEGFSSSSIWHSGSSGQSMWIDPELQRFCIVLTNLFGDHDAGIKARLAIANMAVNEIWQR